MAHPSERRIAARYQFRIAEHLDPHRSGWFDNFTLAYENDGATTLTGPVQDQAHLHGLLARIRDLGVTLISIQIEPTEPTEPTEPPEPTEQTSDA
jgi:hypothetical protein